MGFWPFGGSKKSRVDKSEEMVDTGRNTPAAVTMASTEKHGWDKAGNVSRSSSQLATMEKPAKQSRLSGQESKRTSFLHRSLSKSHDANHPIPSIESGKNAGGAQDSSSRPAKLSKHGTLYKQNPTSDSSLGPETFSVVQNLPTLRAKRADYDPNLPRQKSSKRKAEDHAREREVKAMSSPIAVPARPLTYAGRPSSRDAKQMPGSLNRRLERPTSEISLPLPESFSEMEGFSNQNSFKISMLAALSPRPTVRYDHNPRSALGKQPAHPKLTLQQAIEEADAFQKKRIDHLADNLDSGTLRELMDRDQRRREKKRESDRSTLQRKLQRRADKQREEETRRARGAEMTTGTPSTPEGITAGLGIHTEPSSSPPTGGRVEQSWKVDCPEIEPSKGALCADNPFVDPTVGENGKRGSELIDPFEDEQDHEIVQDAFTHLEESEPSLPVRSPLRALKPVEARPETRPPPATLSPPTSPLQRAVDRHSLSQSSMLGRETTPDIPEDAELDKRASDQSGQYLTSWTTFFRRGGRRTRGSADKGPAPPSEFSNTSRESFSRQNPPPIVPPRSFRRDNSGTPQRTTSRFREDLPDLPISPPDSRVQSPEAAVARPGAILEQSCSRQTSQSLSGTADRRSLANNSSAPLLDRSQQETRLNQQNSLNMDAPEVNPSVAFLSQSLASVGSESSWLTGKPVERTSAQMTRSLRQSQSSLTSQVPGELQPEEHDVTNDEYFRGLSPPPEDRRDSTTSARRKASSTIIDLQKERGQSPEPEVPPLQDRSDETWHGSVGRQPTIVRHASRARSKEGLFNDDAADKAESEPDTDLSASDDDEASIHDFETPVEELAAPVMRATSVEYKGHIRHISAGSARLLDIRRSSIVSEGAQSGENRSTPVSRIHSTVQRENLDPKASKAQ